MTSAISDRPTSTIDASVLKSLRAAQGMRNQLAHTGRGAIHPEKLDEILDAVRVVLRNLDYRRGFSWAHRA